MSEKVEKLKRKLMHQVEPFSALSDKLCSRRGCQNHLGKRKRQVSFCSLQCRLWAYKHPNDDVRPVQVILTARRGRRGGE